MHRIKKDKPEVNIMDYSKVKISISSPEMIRSWSSGEVTKPETINYRTFKPERDGLFCAKIFGPTQDFSCLCGKYKGLKYKGIVCEKCGVEVTLSSVRRERMGHIELNSKVAHIWFFKGVPSRIAVLLEITGKALENIVYFENYIVTDPGQIPDLKFKQILTEEEYIDMVEKYGTDSFKAGIGAEVVHELLKKIELEKEVADLKSRLSIEKSIQKKKIMSRRLKLMEDFFNSGNKPYWMVLDIVPVLPPDLRPLVRLDGGRFASSDLNDLYRRVINRNNRLKKLLDLKAPELIIKNEKRMLQESVDALFDNQKRNKSYMSSQKRPLKSLSDSLKGKQGRFRQNLLGKRVDYSGRSVIVVDPKLKLEECGIPKKMAIELFRPFIYNKLEKKGVVTTLRVARTWVEENRTEVWDALDEVIKEHTVLLNRAPTLHRLGIQAFKPHLVEGNAITLHPMVCPAFNADFDGDQMAVHVPLSLEAQAEAKLLMLSTGNILNPANGKPIAVPTQDMILGFYYLTFNKKGLKGENMIFSSNKDVLAALEKDIIDINAKIRVKYVGKLRNLDSYHLDNQDVANCPETEIKEGENRLLVTTAGRILFNRLLPEGLPYINGLLKKNGIQNIVYYIYLTLGFDPTIVTLDKLKEAGFEYATMAGFTIGLSDLVVPDEKEQIIKDTNTELEKLEKKYNDGKLTAGERHNTIIDKWSRATDLIREKMFENMKKISYEGDSINPLYVMSDSGARGSQDQLKQLAGMRGLMAKPSGEILETPITANFKEGLSVLQYFISTHGARKGLADTALKTADAGYLTRKLVDAAVEVIVKEDDCGTIDGLEVAAIIETGKEIESLEERIIGRFAAEDVISPDEDDKVIVKANEMIDEYSAREILEQGILKLKIRSNITCETEAGVCKKCYGRNLSTGKIINLGEAVGIIAAQSIGEPGTQLTMRTFHIGGVASGTEGQTKLVAGYEGKIVYRDLEVIKNKNDDIIAMNRTGSIQILDSKNREKAIYPVVYGSKILVSEGAAVNKGDLIMQWNHFVNAILTKENGIVEFKDLEENISFVNDRDETTGKITPIVIEIKNEKLRDELQPQVVIRDKRTNKIKRKFLLPVNAHLTVKSEGEVNAGDILAKIPSEFAKTKDITGGLPRVTELFEARKPKVPAKMAQIDGVVQYGKLMKGSRKITIVPFDKNVKPDEHNIPRGSYIIVGDGDKIIAGTPLMDGPLDPVDILTVLGEIKLAEYLLKEVQDVYRLQGVSINDKHIEIIIRQMIKWRRIEEIGDTNFISEQIIEKWKFAKENAKIVENGGKPAKAKPHLLPISRAALANDSFISAAAFQETTKVLTEAAISGKVDVLAGIKENVTMGRLIPAGTGYKLYQDFNVENKSEELLEQTAE